MNVNLDALRSQIEEDLKSRGMAVFRGFPRSSPEAPAVYWDTDSHPDHREFLAAAEAAGVRLMVIYTNEFTGDVLDDAEDRLDALPRDERREMEQRLRQIRGYIGFTCQIELSFDLPPRVYIFDLRTAWFDDLSDLLDQIDDAAEEDDEDPLGPGYFSKN